MKKLLEIKKFYSLILLICIISLISAIYIEHILEQKPCKLCIYQRLPYLVAIFICFFGYNYPKNILWLYLLTFTFLLSSILSGYHVGIENNIFYESAVCTNENFNITDKSKLLESLNNQSPSCKNVIFTVFGLSLATINFMISLLVSITSIVVIKK
jgi:disulfide bond formation protein DsbB